MDAQAFRSRLDDGFGTRSHGRDEFAWQYISLPQDTRKSADFEFAMQGHNAAFGSTTHDDVASGLTENYEPQTLKRAYDRGPRNAGQLRHAQEW